MTIRSQFAEDGLVGGMALMALLSCEPEPELPVLEFVLLGWG